jgi:hypothetical protein
MKWFEVNLETRTWTIPTNRTWTIVDNRTKTAQGHRVPLSDRAVMLLLRQQEFFARGSDYVWPSRRGKPIGAKALYLQVYR